MAKWQVPHILFIFLALSNQHHAWVTQPDHPKDEGPKAGSESRKLEVRAQRAPRLLVLSIYSIFNISSTFLFSPSVHALVLPSLSPLHTLGLGHNSLKLSSIGCGFFLDIIDIRYSIYVQQSVKNCWVEKLNK